MAILKDGAQGRAVAGWLAGMMLGAFVLVIMSGQVTVDAQAWAATTWTPGHATYYGGTDASGTMGGACGYGNLYTSGYGILTGALSVALFNDGLTCGACFQLMCDRSNLSVYGASYCYPGVHITITGTNECPNGSYGGWCDYPKLHFDLSYPMFTSLAQAVAGVIPIQYKRVSCVKWGGAVFTVSGNPYFFLVVPTNIAGKGDVAGMSMAIDTTGWFNMTHTWGQNWELDYHPEFVGQKLSLLVTLGDGQYIDFYEVVPSKWSFGISYQSPYNFS